MAVPDPVGDPVNASYRALFSQPSLARVIVSMQLGRIAGSGLPIILVLYALTVYDSPPLAGALAFLSLFPGLVAAPVIGALLDRLGRLRLIRTDYVVTTVGAGVLAAVAFGGRVPEALLLGVTFLLGHNPDVQRLGPAQPVSEAGTRGAMDARQRGRLDRLSDRDDPGAAGRGHDLCHCRCGAGAARDRRCCMPAPPSR